MLLSRRAIDEGSKKSREAEDKVRAREGGLQRHLTDWTRIVSSRLISSRPE